MLPLQRARVQSLVSVVLQAVVWPPAKTLVAGAVRIGKHTVAPGERLILTFQFLVF